MISCRYICIASRFIMFRGHLEGKIFPLYENQFRAHPSPNSTIFNQLQYFTLFILPECCLRSSKFETFLIDSNLSARASFLHLISTKNNTKVLFWIKFVQHYHVYHGVVGATLRRSVPFYIYSFQATTKLRDNTRSCDRKIT